MPVDEFVFAQTENNVKGTGNVNDNLIVAFRVMQNVIACSTKRLWSPKSWLRTEKHCFFYKASYQKPIHDAISY